MRACARALVLAAVFLSAPGHAQDLEGDVRRLLTQGAGPESAARQLIARGVYPEDVAATLFRAAPAVLTTFARLTGNTPERAAALVDAADAVGANAMREVQEALAGLPLQAIR